MKPVRVGVIGIGNMGWHHARVLSLLRDAELIGVADPDAVRGQLAVEQFGCRWFPSYTDLLQEVEAVCIAVPTLLHHRVGMACLQAGVHVLIEKPIAASQEEAADLIRAAEGSARLLQVGHIERFNPAFRELTKVVANEQVVVLEARRHSPNGDRANDVSVVLDLMIHDIDLVHSLVPGAVSEIRAEGLIEYGPHADEVFALLHFANGTVAKLETSRVATERKRGLRAVYADGVVEIDFLSRTVKNTTPRPLGALEMGDPLGEAVGGFVAAAKAGTDALVTPEQAAQALETALWIEQASGVAVPASQTRAVAGR